MENIKLRQLAIEFFENHLNPTEDDLYDFLEENEWRIYADYQKQSLKNTITTELDEDFDVSKIPDNLIDDMAFTLEEMVYDEYDFRDDMHELLDYYKEDLEEYKLEGNE